MTQDSSIKGNKINKNAGRKKTDFFSKAMIHNGIIGFKHNFKLTVVLFVLHMAAAPLTLSMLMLTAFTKGRAEAEVYAVIAVLTTGAAAAAGILCALSAMPYLYKKSVVDMRLSLPLTTLQRFVSDFLSGLCVYVLPFMASSIISLLLTLAGHIACDGKTFYAHPGDPGWECHMFEQIAPVLIKGIIGGIFIMVMFYTLTLLVSCCCGSVFECICYTLLANGLIPGSIAMTVYALLEDVYGLVPTSYITQSVPYTSPVGGCIGLVFSLQSSVTPSRGANVPTELTYVKWLLLFGLATLVYIVCTYLIYRKRQAEDTGNPIVYSALFHVIMTLGTACIVFAFMVNGDSVLPMLIITGIIYFVFSVVRRRGFKKFWRSAISYGCTLVVCMGSYAVVKSTDCFGAGSYVPKASDVTEVYLDYAGAYEASAYVDWFTGQISETGNGPMKITDRDSVRIITDVHGMIVSDERTGGRSKSFEVLYRLKNGRLVIRDYSLTDDEILALSALDMTTEAKEYRANAAKAKAEYIWHLGDEYHSDDNFTVTLSSQWRVFDDTYGALHGQSAIRTARLPSDFGEELGKCLYSDIMDETEEDYFTDSHGTMTLSYNDKGYYRNDERIIAIRSYYGRTLGYLQSCGFKTEFEMSPTFGLAAANSVNIHIISDKIMENMTGKQITTFTPTRIAQGEFSLDKTAAGVRYTDVAEYARVKVVYGLTDDLNTVLANSYKRYKTDESCYTITVNGNAAVVDPRFNAAAERLFIVTTIQDWIINMTNGDAFRIYSGKDLRSENYKDFLYSFLLCCGRDAIDAYAAPGVSVYDLIYEYAKGSGKKGLGMYANGNILADKYTARYSSSYYTGGYLQNGYGDTESH